MRPKKYTKIAEELTELIVNGQLGPGAQIPSQHELTRQYDVSRSCVQKALDLLAERGLVDKKPGKGVFVKSASEPGESPGRALGLLMPTSKPVTPTPQDSFGVETLWGIEEAVRERGLNLVLRRHDRYGSFDDIAAVLAGMEVGGLVVDRDFPDACLRTAVVAGLPLVVAGRLCSVPGVGCTVPNFYDYIYQTIHALDEHGTGRVALFYPAPHDYGPEALGAVSRLAGEGRRIVVDAIDVFGGREPYDPTLEEQLVKELVGKMVDDDALPDVIICVSDWTAARVLEVLNARAVPVPGRVGLIGGLGIAIAAQMSPTISSLVVDSRALGCRAVEILTDMVFDNQPSRIERLPLTLVERESFRFNHSAGTTESG